MSNISLASNQLNHPPIRLVQTWCLLSRDKDEEVSQHNMQMLLNTFGDMKTVVEFVKRHKIRV
jgi:hypothetical protein